ncbi:glycosyltransferase family 4 protein [Cellulomonas aerilata]|uniref:Glycosyl transferase family 1 domain-containing protein n=1 Tax=Cellulomonas aerilata TaxID=515326 RepID=A0A512DE66_9CELL|nr:glycosyltransferase family 4 protein [Cellulomonas aerilata]GEO34520.1 hypothetical protein CAE01nite_22450 [Cellulomonas aerilata]
MILIVDPKSGRGGGQVVLEELLVELGDAVPVSLAMPPASRDGVRIPPHVATFDTASDALAAVAPAEPVLVVANANAALPVVHRVSAQARRDGRPVASAAIVHNYPVSRLKGAVTKHLLGRVDTAIVVEPGLTTLRSDAVIPSWLSVRRSDVPDVPARITSTRRVKAFARPDASKGLHLLPAIFTALEAAGFPCEVALGTGLTGDRRYEARLRDDLAPWLVRGPRDASWIEPGDLFVVASTGGETACLAAQEAMSRGAVVAASRIGLMPYLTPVNHGIRTFAIGDRSGAVAAALELLTLPPARFDAESRAGAAMIADRAGRWYVDARDLLLDRHERLAGTLVAGHPAAVRSSEDEVATCA